MKTLSLLTTVTLLTCFVSGCNSPKADTSPNSRKADEGPPLVGPDVQVWKLTLGVRATGQHAWIDVRSNDKDMDPLSRSTGPGDVVSFEGTWKGVVFARYYPSYVLSTSLVLEANGDAEYVREDGHEELPGPKYVRDKITHHLVGKWKQTSDTTATVWLQPAPLVGRDVEVWKLTLNVVPQGNYAWIDVLSDDKAMRPLDRSTGPEDVVSFEGVWEYDVRTADHPSSSITTITLMLDANGGAEYVYETGHELLGPIYVRDNIIRHLVGKWRQTSDTTATIWLEPAAAP